MYADHVTKSMQKTIDETQYRREKQMAYNDRNNITPQALNKALDETFQRITATPAAPYMEKTDIAYLSKEALQVKVRETRKEMEKAAKDMDFIQAAHFRDEIERIQNQLKTLP